VKDLDRDDIARRVQEAKEDVADARDDNTRTRAEQYLSELTTLQGALQAA
jgi:F-type H+-transporting ATPase subunit epsilon